MNPSFLLDENVRGALRNAIRSHNARGLHPIDAVCVGDVADLPLGSPDPEILDWASRNGRILVTRDLATMLTFLLARLDAGKHSAGVLIVREGFSLSEIVDHLASIAWAAEPSEYLDRFEHMP